MKKKICSFCYDPAMSAATVLSPLTAFAEAEEQELNICHFPGWIWGCLLESDGGAF